MNNWASNPGYIPPVCIGNRVDVIAFDGGIIEDLDADYQDWGLNGMLDDIKFWKLHNSKEK